ncbi:hypothetical protein DAPPUDRAFT_239628 [Daphnia pulex]|uniref:Uncharacterized protein n=1 Tax=Daphnia pulex TaxID=6669 RepID=E9G9Q2_DAPPU|nr:hypothetical protein DAPPUDRAFT_239628 [Daphnia pulex]|eukprot:EFX83610.1 hypothetical protein DAPPUDRAFT_239628 [Daphnia pulex]
MLGSVAPKEATNVMNDQPDKDVPDDVPDYVPDYFPEYVPDDVPDDVPVDEGLHRVADLVRRDDSKGKEESNVLQLVKGLAAAYCEISFIFLH